MIDPDGASVIPQRPVSRHRVARYIIVLDRYDDDDYPGGAEQVAAELQEAMNETGEPAGFFNVISRKEYTGYPEDGNVGGQEPHRVRPNVITQLQEDAHD